MGNRSSSTLKLDSKDNHGRQLSGLLQAIETAKVTKKLHICSGLNRFPDEALEQCQQLKELKIKYISVRVIPDNISVLQHLQVLLLQRCQLQSIPQSIGQLDHLTSLILCSNELTSIPTHLYDCHSLTLLNLGSNKLSEIPQGIGTLTKLTLLLLDQNRINSLPPDVTNLQHLAILGLGNNKFNEIPPQVMNLTRLQKLWLIGNTIPQVPDWMTTLHSLNDLGLQGMHTIPPLFRLSRLSRLQLTNVSAVSPYLPPSTLVLRANTELCGHRIYSPPINCFNVVTYLANLQKEISPPINNEKEKDTLSYLALECIVKHFSHPAVLDSLHLLPYGLRDKCLKVGISESLMNDEILLKLLGEGMAHVSFCGYWKTTDELVCTIVRKCPNLQFLSLSGCSKITDLALHGLQCSHQLTGIDLTCCFNITNEGLIALFSACQLQKLILSDNIHLEPTIMDYMSGLCSNSLIELSLNNINISYFSTLSKLEIIKLSHIGKYDKLKHKLAQSVATYFPNLQIVNIGISFSYSRSFGKLVEFQANLAQCGSSAELYYSDTKFECVSGESLLKIYEDLSIQED